VTGGHGRLSSWAIPRKFQTNAIVEGWPPTDLRLNAAGFACDEFGRSASGRWIVTPVGNDEAVVLDRQGHSATVVLGKHPEMRFTTLSPDGQWAATCTVNHNDVHVWNAQTGELATIIPIKGGGRVVFSPKGDWLVVNMDHACAFVQSGTWQILHRIDAGSHSTNRWLGRVAFSRDGELLAVSRSRQSIQLIALSPVELLMTLESLVHTPLCFTPDNRALLAYGQNGEIFRWNIDQIRTHLEPLGLGWTAR
jgi:WD40 repeat protein